MQAEDRYTSTVGLFVAPITGSNFLRKIGLSMTYSKFNLLEV